MDIYVQKDGQRLGPLPETRIREGANAGRFGMFLLAFVMLTWLEVAGAQQTPQEWQATATKEFPQLAVRNSLFNRVYVAAYADLKTQSPKSLNSPEIFYLLAVITSQVLSDPINEAVDPSVLGKTAANKIPDLQSIISKIDNGSFITTVEVKQVDPEGVLGKTYTTKSIVHEEDHVEQGQTTFGPGMITHHVTKTVEVQKTPISDSVFVAGIHNLAPNQEWTGRIWPAGTFEFHPASGESKHIERWATSRLSAIILCLQDETKSTPSPTIFETASATENTKQRADSPSQIGPFIHIDPKRLLDFLNDMKMDGGHVNVEYSQKYHTNVCISSFGIYFITEFVGPPDAASEVHVVANWNNGALSKKLSAHDDSITIFIHEVLHICGVDASDWLNEQLDDKQGVGMHTATKVDGDTTISATVNIAANEDETIRLEYTVSPNLKNARSLSIRK